MAEKKPRNVTPIDEWLRGKIDELRDLRDESDGSAPDEASEVGLNNFVFLMTNQGGRGRPDEIACNHQGLWSATWSNGEGAKIKITFRDEDSASFRTYVPQTPPVEPVNPVAPDAPAAGVAPTE